MIDLLSASLQKSTSVSSKSAKLFIEKSATGIAVLNNETRRKIFSQIIVLMKNILLSAASDGKAGRLSFFAGGIQQWPISAIGAIQIQWWLTPSGRNAEVSLAKLVIGDSELESVDSISCASHARRILQEICIDQDFFDVAAVLKSTKKNLFECISCDKNEFCKKFYEILRHSCMSDIKLRATIIPIMPRLFGDSFSIDCEGVGLIRRDDPDNWRKILGGSFECHNWNPHEAAFSGESPFFAGDRFLYYAFGIDKGTHASCLDRSMLKIRKLLSIIVAKLALNRKFPLHTSIAEAPRHYIQFSENGSKIPWHASGDEPVLPSYASDISISKNDISEIIKWYEARRNFPSEKLNRLNIGCHFVNLALNAKPLDRFVFFYISLDALFGRRNNVENSIREGVSEFSKAYVRQSDWLYELRNEIIHGGSRRVSEWSRYERYVSHFRSQPEQDMQMMALECLYRYK